MIDINLQIENADKYQLVALQQKILNSLLDPKDKSIYLAKIHKRMNLLKTEDALIVESEADKLGGEFEQL